MYETNARKGTNDKGTDVLIDKTGLDECEGL